MKKVGFFDADCREISDEKSLVFRPRVEPMAEKFNRLYRFAQEHDIVLVFTTCCSGKMLEPDSRKDVLFIPLNIRDTSWEEHVDDYRLIYLQKKTYHNPAVNFECKAFETFTDNGNAAILMKMLGIEEWIVFGNGLDFCVDHAVKSILKAGLKVTFLSDAMIPAAKGYGNSGTEENKIETFRHWCRMGAVQQTVDQFFMRYDSRIPAAV